MKVTLFVTCLVDMFETNVGKATVEVLERLGCEIEFPEAQVCCGQPAYNSGHVEAAKEAMKHMIETFEDAEYIVTPSGSCATMFHEYPHVLKMIRSGLHVHKKLLIKHMNLHNLL